MTSTITRSFYFQNNKKEYKQPTGRETSALWRLSILSAISSGGSNVYRWPHGPGRWSSLLKAADPYEVTRFKEVAETIKRLRSGTVPDIEENTLWVMTSSGTFKTRKTRTWLIDWIWGSTRKTGKKNILKAHLSAWPSHSPSYTPVYCPPSGSTHPLWLAASYTRCRQSSEGDRRSPALSAPPDSAGCPADTPHILSRTSCRDKQGPWLC